MDFAPAYLIQRFFYRIADFFHHWYVDGSRVIGHKFISTLEDMDQTFALKITFRYFFQPLYRDFSVIGRILGIIFRFWRIVLGGMVYFFIAVLFLTFYLAWVAAPVFILFNVLRPIF